MRPLESSLLLIALALLPACSRSHAPSVAESAFPIRLFPTSAAADSNFLLDARLGEPGELQKWWMLRPDAKPPAIARAVADPAVERLPDSLRLDPPSAALVRFVEIAPGAPVEIEARLAPDPRYADGQPCAQFFLVLVRALGDNETVAMALGAAETSTERTEAVRTAVASRVATQFGHQRKEMQSQWLGKLDVTGFAGARFTLPERPVREMWALIFVAEGGPLHIAQCTLRHPVEWNRLSGGSGTAISGAHGLASRIRPTKLTGERYRCARLESDSPLELLAEHAAGATALELQVALDPDGAKPLRNTLRVQVETRPPVLATVFEKHFRDLDIGLPFFATVVVPWPAMPGERDPAAPVRIRIEVDRGTAMLVGEPILRGPPVPDRPNLLVISLDTLRADHLGCYGYARPTTPNLDRFATSAMLFERCTSVSSYTLPTHASLLTGLLPYGHGAIRPEQLLDTTATPTLARVLADRGYVTAAFTSGGFLSDEYGFAAGFDRYGQIDPITTEDATTEGRNPTLQMLRARNSLDAAGGWIDEHAAERWFVFVHSFVTHEYLAPAEDLASFDRGGRATPGRDVVAYLLNEEWFASPPTEGDVARIVDRYDAALHYADRRLGAFLDRLERAGRLDDTIVVVTADHGEELFEHGSLRHSATLYQEQLHVPLLVRVPRRFLDAAPRRIAEPISQADVMPTLLELLGAPPLDRSDGRSQVGLLLGDRTRYVETPLFAVVDTQLAAATALRRGRWKVIHNSIDPPRKASRRTEWELYDLQADPGETADLRDARPEDFARMRALHDEVLAALIARAAEGTSVTPSPELMERLRQLGYVGR